MAEDNLVISKHDWELVNKRAEKAFLTSLYGAYMNKVKAVEAANVEISDIKEGKKSNPD